MKKILCFCIIGISIHVQSALANDDLTPVDSTQIQTTTAPEGTVLTSVVRYKDKENNVMCYITIRNGAFIKSSPAASPAMSCVKL